MTTAISTLKQLPANKEQVELFSNKLMAELDAGDIDPLEAKFLFKALEEVQKAIKSKLDALALKEANKYPEKTFELTGFKVEKAELGVKHDYSNCGDPDLAKLEWESETADKKLKDRQEFLKKLPIEGIEVIDKETGEILQIYPPVKKSSEGLKITMK